MNSTSMMTHEHLIDLLVKQYPDAVHGRNIWVAHPIAGIGGEQIGPAHIVQWDLEAPQPTELEIERLDAQYGREVARSITARNLMAQRDAMLRTATDRLEAALDQGDNALAGRIRAYRKALRSVETQTGWPERVRWPEMPTAS